jgi:protein-tyrosine-phosphatase
MLAATPYILFVCTGNICRSPMAEYLFREHHATEHGWRVGGAGTHAPVGSPASREAVKALKEVGIDLRPHRSRQLTDALVDEADLIVVMTEGHRQICLERFPAAADKVHVLKSFDPRALDEDVMDPIGYPIPVYRAVRDEIASALYGLESYVLGGGLAGEE